MKEADDFERPLNKKDTTGARVNRISALSFYLNECNRLNICFKEYSKKGPS